MKRDREPNEKMECGLGFEKFWGEEPPSDKKIAEDMRNLFNWCNPHSIFWSPMDYQRCPICYDGIKAETSLE